MTTEFLPIYFTRLFSIMLLEIAFGIFSATLATIPPGMPTEIAPWIPSKVQLVILNLFSTYLNMGFLQKYALQFLHNPVVLQELLQGLLWEFVRRFCLGSIPGIRPVISPKVFVRINSGIQGGITQKTSDEIPSVVPICILYYINKQCLCNTQYSDCHSSITMNNQTR